MKAVYVIEACGCEWSQAVAVADTRRRAAELVETMQAYQRNAPVVDWNSNDHDKVLRQFDRAHRYFKRGIGGEHVQHATEFRISRVRLWIDGEQP